MAILIINFIAYLLLFIIYQCKKKQFDLGSVILLVWIIGSVGSVWYYTFSLTQIIYRKIQFVPLIYIFIINLFMFYPFCKKKYSHIKSVNIYNLGQLLKIISVFFSIVIIPVFVVLLFKLATFQFVGAALSEMYSAEVDKATLLLPSSIKPFYSIIRHFTQFIIFLFFYNLTLKKKEPLITIGLGMNLAVFFMMPIMGGSRGGVITTLLSCVFYYFMLKDAYSDKTRRLVRKISIGVMGILIIGIGAISISRLDGYHERGRHNATMDQWIAQYAGEGNIRFSDIIWESDYINLGGVQTIPVVFSLRDPGIKNLDNAILKYDRILRSPIWMFYTYIGDFVIDYGKVGGALVLILISFFIRYLIKQRNNLISIFKLIILNYFFILLTVGITADVYRTYYTQIEIIYVLTLLFILSKINPFITNIKKSWKTS